MFVNSFKSIAKRFLAGVAGFEPTRARVKVLCLTAWRHPNVCGGWFVAFVTFVTNALVDLLGLEPRTDRL